MRLVVFGLSISSSWGNGHATLWRGLVRALARRGTSVVFFERDVPYYREHRDLVELEGLELRLYEDWREVVPAACAALASADAAIVTSFCPDGVAATELALESGVPLRAFYDLDTPVTLEKARRGERIPWLGAEALAPFHLVLSYTGGSSLADLERLLGAKRTRPLYGWVDPDVHQPKPPASEYAGDLSYLGTYALDRQPALDALFLEPSRRRPRSRFVLGGSLYPADFPWTDNLYYVRHVEPARHPAFYASSRLTLSITRRPFAEVGWCPSGRLFEAAACGTALVTDTWPGFEEFFTPGREAIACATTEDVLGALDLAESEVARIAAAARERVLAEHTAARRAVELETALRRVTGGE
jgi:spore maturation protein CgeB